MRFELSFCSDKPVAVEAKLTVKVEDSQYNSGIQVTGEAHWKKISLDNISNSLLDGSRKDKGMKIRMSIKLIRESVVKWKKKKGFKMCKNFISCSKLT